MGSPQPYDYRSPEEKGRKRVYITRTQHNQLFKHEKRNWHFTYEYYLGEDEVELHRFNTLFTKFLMILTFPISIFWAGISNFKELVWETKREMRQKRYGSFSSMTYYRRNFEGFDQFKSWSKVKR